MNAPDAQTTKRALIAAARDLDPAARDLKGRVTALRDQWRAAGRSATKAIDDRLWAEFSQQIDAVFAARIPRPQDAAGVRDLARVLAREWTSWMPVTSQTKVTEKVGLFRKEEVHRAVTTELFMGYCLSSRTTYEGHVRKYPKPHPSDALTMIVERSLELWLRTDGEIMAVEACEVGLLPSSFWYTERTAARATDAQLSDKDCLFKARKMDPTMAKDVIYEFEKWKDGRRWRLGLHIGDLLYNTRRNAAMRGTEG